MSTESAADRASFFNVNDFGVDALWKGTDTIQGVFDNEFFETVASSGEVGVQSSKPVFMVTDVQVVGAASGDTLVSASVNYKIIDVQPDGTGLTMLVLEVQ